MPSEDRFDRCEEGALENADRGEEMHSTPLEGSGELQFPRAATCRCTSMIFRYISSARGVSIARGDFNGSGSLGTMGGRTGSDTKLMLPGEVLSWENSADDDEMGTALLLLPPHSIGFAARSPSACAARYPPVDLYDSGSSEALWNILISGVWRPTFLNLRLTLAIVGIRAIEFHFTHNAHRHTLLVAAIVRCSPIDGDATASRLPARCCFPSIVYARPAS